MAKSTKEPIHLVSSEGTNFVYTFARRRGKTKLSVKKYDPIARKHVVFNEKKVSRLARKYKPGQSAGAGKGADKTGGAAAEGTQSAS